VLDELMSMLLLMDGFRASFDMLEVFISGLTRVEYDKTISKSV
jgi:hypothetical protein